MPAADAGSAGPSWTPGASKEARTPYARPTRAECESAPFERELRVSADRDTLRTMSTLTRRYIALRVPERALAQIDGLAERHGLTRTAYMVRASTGELEDPTDLRAEFDSIQQRLDRLEQLAFGS